MQDLQPIIWLSLAAKFNPDVGKLCTIKPMVCILQEVYISIELSCLFLNLNILCLLLLCIQPIEPSYCVGALDEISQNLSSNLYLTLLSNSLFFSFKNNNSVVMGIAYSMIHFKNSISPICI